MAAAASACLSDLGQAAALDRESGGFTLIFNTWSYDYFCRLLI